MPLLNGDTYDVGDRPLIVFSFTPLPQRPSNECTAVTVTVKKPDGNKDVYTSPDATLTSATHVETIGGVSTLITEWTFEFPTPFDQGSDRAQWEVKCQGTAGVIAVATTARWVRRDSFA